MNERAKSGWPLAMTALVAGVLGELFSPDIFLYGAGVGGVIVFQILFFVLILLGLYTATGEILRERGVIQSPSVPVPENASTETPGASAEEFQTRLNRNLWYRTMFPTTLVAGVLSILLLPGPYMDVIISILAGSSLVAGFYCAVSTPFLRMGMVSHDQAIVNFSSVVLVVTTVLWVFAQRIAYLIIVGDMAASGYIALARLSSVALLAFASLGLLELGLVIYFSRPKYRRTMEPAQKQTWTPA